MQNINELIGIIKGISYDGVINGREIEYLNSWVDGNRCFVTCINEKKLMDLIDKALEDCVLSDSERKTILLIAQELLKNVENQYASYAELNGIIEGIISDDVINIKEMYKLNEWFVSHSEISDENSKCIHTVVEKILEDRIIPQQKRQELFNYLSSKNEYIKFESKLLYLKSLIRNKKNVGIELIDLLDRNDYMLKIHSRAESVLANTLNSYTCFFVEDPDIVILSLTLIAMLDYDGSYYDSVSKVYKSLYDRYSKSKIEGLIRSILNRYRLDIDKSSRPRIINYVLRQAIVPKNFLPNFFEFIFDIYISIILNLI